MRTRNTLAMIALFAAAGCGQRPAEIPADMGTSTEQFRAEAEELVNRYALALYQGDTDTLASILSSEVTGRLATYPGGMPRFIEKQKKSMLTTFPTMAANGMGKGFQVKSVARQEGSVAVTLLRDGAELTRPFYFVLEGGSYKLNVGRPGFSKALPAGAAANDTYVVTNTNCSGPNCGSVIASCYSGGTVTVPGGTSKSVSCPNTCGFWSGAYFWGTNWVGTNYCDYNTWGTDVWYQPFMGMYCNDGC
jgi:hypothetical protein